MQLIGLLKVFLRVKFYVGLGGLDILAGVRDRREQWAGLQSEGFASFCPCQQKVMGIGVGGIALDFHKKKCPIYNAKSKSFGGGRGREGG